MRRHDPATLAGSSTSSSRADPVSTAQNARPCEYSTINMMSGARIPAFTNVGHLLLRRLSPDCAVYIAGIPAYAHPCPAGLSQRGLPSGHRCCSRTSGHHVLR